MSSVSLSTCWKHLSMSRFPSFTTPAHEQGTLMLPSPATSPSFKRPTRNSTVVVDSGPMTRCVSVLRAHISCEAGRAWSRNRPPVSCHSLSSGLWFHCQMRPNRGPLKSSLRSYGARRGCPCTGFVHVRGARPRLPSSPTIGHPSFHVTGMRSTVRPMEWKSCMSRAHHCPSGVETMPP